MAADLTDEELSRLVSEQEARIVRRVTRTPDPVAGGRRGDLSPAEAEALRAEQDAQILRILFENPAVNGPTDVTRARVEEAARRIGASLKVTVKPQSPPTPVATSSLTDDEIDRLVERAKLGGYRGPPPSLHVVEAEEESESELFDQDFGRIEPEVPAQSYWGWVALAAALVAAICLMVW